MTKSEIANAKDLYSLRELYNKYHPKQPLWKREMWCSKILKAREMKK